MTRVSTRTPGAGPTAAHPHAVRGPGLSRAVQCAAAMHHQRIAFTLLLGLSAAACVEDEAATYDDEPVLAEATEELSVSDSVRSGFYLPVTPSTLRGPDWRVQVVGTNASGYVAWDIQPEPGLWGTPNPTVVATPVAARYVAAAQDGWGRTVIFAVTGSLLLRTQQTQPGSRIYNNWIYVDSAVMEREPSLAIRPDGKLVVAYVSSTGRVKTSTQTASGGAWANAVDAGYATTGTPELVRDRQDRLELFVPRATAPCGFTYSRQRVKNGADWYAPINVSSACFTTVTVGYADDATDVLGRTAAGSISHLTRDTSDALFRTGTQSFAGNAAIPTIVAKDDGRLFAFTGFTGCPTGFPAGSPGCGTYYGAQREGGGWWSWQPFLRTTSASAVAAVDSIINNTYLFALTGSSREYTRSLFRY